MRSKQQCECRATINARASQRPSPPCPVPQPMSTAIAHTIVFDVTCVTWFPHLAHLFVYLQTTRRLRLFVCRVLFSTAVAAPPSVNVCTDASLGGSSAPSLKVAHGCRAIDSSISYLERTMRCIACPCGHISYLCLLSSIDARSNHFEIEIVRRGSACFHHRHGWCLSQHVEHEEVFIVRTHARYVVTSICRTDTMIRIGTVVLLSCVRIVALRTRRARDHATLEHADHC